MPRRRSLRILYALYEKGSYGKCACGGSIYYYSDQGVRCDQCKRLYGVWNSKKSAIEPKDAKDAPAITEPSQPPTKTKK